MSSNLPGLNVWLDIKMSDVLWSLPYRTVARTHAKEEQLDLSGVGLPSAKTSRDLD